MAHAVTSKASFTCRSSQTGASSTRSSKSFGPASRTIQRERPALALTHSTRSNTANGIACKSRSPLKVTANDREPVMVPAVPVYGGEQMTDVMSFLRMNRIIFIGEPITDKTCLRVVQEMLLMERQDPDAEIAIYLNSIDGVPFSVMALVDMINALKCPVSTVCFGMCGGLSTLILSAGKKGRRFAMPNSRIMIHQPISGVQGSSFEVAITATETNHTLKVINQMFSEFTGLSVDQMEEEIDRENFFSPQEAIDLGFIDAMC